MARSPIDLPRMQNQPRSRVPAARAPESGAAGRRSAAPKARKPQLMRQYELIDRVKQYNPHTNEDLLNRAYVYAMRAHGEQKRASGDPYISHPLEVAAILTELKLDDATIAAALLHDTIEDTDATRAEIDRLFGHEIGRAGRGADQTQAARSGLQGGEAGREPAQASARHRRRRAGAADQARRPAAQYAHAFASSRPKRAAAPPRKRSTSMRRSPAAWACRRCARNSRTWRSASSIPDAYKVISRAARGAGRAQQRLDHRDRTAARQEARATAASPPKSPAGASAPIRSGARWSARRSASSSSRNFRLPRRRRQRRPSAIRRSASCTRRGRSCRGVLRTTSRRRNRTITARSIRP